MEHAPKSISQTPAAKVFQPVQQRPTLAETFQFKDNRPEASAQRNIQSLADHFTTNQASVQLKALVFPSDISEKKVVLEAHGKASDFQGGSDAKSNGWNGVKKYKADAKVGETDINIGMINNKYIVGQAGHVLAQQNGGDGGDTDNVFAQDGGVNNGPYRSNFENPMRKALNEADDDDEVKFRAVLYGDDIKSGALIKTSENLEGSDEETDFEGF